MGQVGSGQARWLRPVILVFYLLANPESTPEEVSVGTSISTKTVYRQLREMYFEGFLHRRRSIGKNARPTYRYEVAK